VQDNALISSSFAACGLLPLRLGCIIVCPSWLPALSFLQPTETETKTGQVLTRRAESVTTTLKDDAKTV
jgi:hypothetical protein